MPYLCLICQLISHPTRQGKIAKSQVGSHFSRSSPQAAGLPVNPCRTRAPWSPPAAENGSAPAMTGALTRRDATRAAETHPPTGAPTRWLTYRTHQTECTMDPNHLESLEHAFASYGPVLVAAMNPMPSAGNKGPMPYGCLVQWHAHQPLLLDHHRHHRWVHAMGAREPQPAHAGHDPRLADPGPRRSAGPRPVRSPDGGGGQRPNTTRWHQPPERSQPRPGRGLPSGSSRGRAVRQCRSGAIRKNHR